MTDTHVNDWAGFWDAKSISPTDFQATGRGGMDVIGFLYTVKEIVRILELHAHESLLDIGCGTGLISLSLAPWLSSIKGFDISHGMVERARKNLSHVPNVTVAVGAITSLNEPESSCDKVLAYSVLQYLADESVLQKALNEVFRVMRPGGRALLAANPDPSCRWRLEDVIKARVDQDAAQKELGLLDQLLWVTPERMLALAEEAGFAPRIEPISPCIWQHFYMFDLVLDKHG